MPALSIEPPSGVPVQFASVTKSESTEPFQSRTAAFAEVASASAPMVSTSALVLNMSFSLGKLL